MDDNQKETLKKLGASAAAVTGLYVLLKIGKYLFYILFIWYFLAWIMDLIEYSVKS